MRDLLCRSKTFHSASRIGVLFRAQSILERQVLPFGEPLKSAIFVCGWSSTRPDTERTIGVVEAMFSLLRKANW